MKEIGFQYDKIFSDQVKTYFGGSTIIMEEDFALSKEANKALGVSNFVIPAGKYPLKDGKVYFKNR